jgi:nucleoid DNA-binding protein
MSRVAVDWRSSSKDNYNLFCKKHPSITLTYDEWRNILYTFNELFKEYILETGEKVKMPFGFGEFSINKKKRRKKKGLNDEFINLPIDWQKTKEKIGKLKDKNAIFELIKLINQYPMTKIGKMFNVSDNAIRKWLR